MPEHRGRKHHQDRVAETLRVEIGVLIEGELVDPRINLCYVTEVALNPGGKSARVYVAVDSAVKDIAKAEEETVAGLEAAKGMCPNSASLPTVRAAFRRVSTS
jgi:ribosome-binding factor A